ncbi:SDR family oxidoreductase [Nisaea acidiphila]|uniref:SDR family oxidoreductase n=1 Tax=Nisaea acidiphila TaxID=1862145 RepID=A0A9J7AVW0_9PROT|nr:SDR family oxidoreductase [Nisaea acidiphila]UUX50938.1 SDR family oxidoreductase [Nisaea acidiphila]
MDLGIKGKKALVCASSKGLGKASALALAQNGVDLTICSRTPEAIEAAADEIRSATGVTVHAVACDITTPEGREKALAPFDAKIDILVNNAGGPPPGNFRDWTRDDWIKAVDGNMLTAIDLIKATIDGMIERKWGRIVNITSGAVKSPIAILGLSNGARAGLTGFCAGIAREVAKDGVTINGLLPGPFDTDRLRGNMKIQAEKAGVDFETFFAQHGAEHTAGRFGTPDEFGQTCAFLCSAHAGYINGQNLLMDGGAFRSTL